MEKMAGRLTAYLDQLKSRKPTTTASNLFQELTEPYLKSIKWSEDGEQFAKQMKSFWGCASYSWKRRTQDGHIRILQWIEQHDGIEPKSACAALMNFRPPPWLQKEKN